MGDNESPPPVKPPSAMLNMNRGFSAFSSRRPLDRGSSRGPGRSSRSPFTSSAAADGAELMSRGTVSTRVPGLLSVLYRPLKSYPPGTQAFGSPDSTSPAPSRTQGSHSSTHYLFCPNPLFPPPASPCVPVHPSASPPPSLLASTLWLWERAGDRKGGCHPHLLTPEEGAPTF